MSPAQKNKKMAQRLVVIALVMLGVSFAAVPLYRLFCQVTGFGGTTGRGAAAPAADKIVDRAIIVQFDAMVHPDLPWQFGPEQKSVTVNVGEAKPILYRATNTSSVPQTGSAVFNVTPPKAGKYFIKTQCFCFDRQTIQPGETVEFPVMFYIDPSIMDNKNAADISLITLSYTFYKADSPQWDKAQDEFMQRE